MIVITCRGTTVPGKGLAEVIQQAEARGATGAEVDKVEKEWLEEHPLCTFNQGEVVEQGTHQELLEKGGLYHSMWIEQAYQGVEEMEGDVALDPPPVDVLDTPDAVLDEDKETGAVPPV